MVYFSATLVTILVVEILFRLPLMRLIGKLTTAHKKVARVVLSKSISDHWKEKVLLAYSGDIALTTLKIAAIIGGLGLAFLVASAILDKMLRVEEPTVDFLMTWQGIGVASMASISFSLVRRSYVSK